MTPDECRLFLTEYNRELLEYPEELHNCPAEVATTG
ncbi:hypothetical protein HNQ39_000540 [Armatimonas rosea]|uniref:Uncharacterized protein n=1 Tax=Armatimonas rosea TaxID=685828 RepID=A0A7W9SMW3_ARMRO|nr:hypothetical protein [Armatimonas rosea]